jgi:hypothetical protein
VNSINTATAVLLAAVLESEGIDEFNDIGFLVHTPKSKVEAMLENTRLETNAEVSALLRFAIDDASTSTTGVIEKVPKRCQRAKRCLQHPLSSLSSSELREESM